MSAPVKNAIITVKGPFSGLVITNTTNGYKLQSSTVGAGASDWLRFDSGRNTVEVSADSGATWADDQANFVRATDQVGLMVLDPGDNSFDVAGANGGTVVFQFYETFG